MKYATVNNEGVPVAFFDARVSGPRKIIDASYSGEGPAPLVDNPNTKIPPDAIEITHEQWRELVDNPRKRRLEAGNVVEHTITRPLGDYKRGRRREINNSTRRNMESAGWDGTTRDYFLLRHAQLVGKQSRGQALTPPEETELAEINGVIDWALAQTDKARRAAGNAGRAANHAAVDAVVDGLSFDPPPVDFS